MRRKEILGAYLSVFAGKIQENRRGFLGRFKGAPGGNSQSPRARFLLPAFSFGEAKENAERQLQVCHKVSTFQQPAVFFINTWYVSRET